jgi:hypothetical protein
MSGFAQNCNLSLVATPVATSCSNACDGSVILTPSGGTAPYSFNAFEHTFPGSTVDLNLFEVRNGNFSVSGNQLTAKANAASFNDYDNSITTKTAFADNGKIVVEGSFYIDYNTYGNFGLAENAVITDQGQLPYSFFFSYGTLYVMTEGNLTEIMNYSSSTWYDLKIEKLGTTVNYYLRSTGLATYSLVATTTATPGNANYKLSALYNNFSNFYGGFKTTNWRVGGNPPTSGLCPGTYSYTVFDANGCYATAGITLGVNNGPGSLTLNGSATSASCASAADGTTSLLPSGGTGPYSYGFSHVFQGGTINQNIFELRNGNFSQGSDLREGTNYNNNNSWDNSVSTRRTFSDGGYLLYEGTFKFDANADLIFGFSNTGVIDDYADVLMGFRVSNGTAVYAYTNNAGLVTLPSILPDTWYDFKIEKTGNTIRFYNRLMNTGSYVLRYTRSYSSGRVEYKAAALNFASFYSSNGGYNTKGWNVQSTPKTDNLLPGTYTYTISDANGCSATKVLNVIADIVNVVSLNATLVNGACGSAANGAVSLTPVAGKAPYSYAFTQSFSGNMIQAGLFDVRNGSFIQDGGSLRGDVIPVTTQWDNSITTYYTFTDAAKLGFEGSFKFDPTANVYFGFLSNVAPINDPSQVQIGYFINGTQLFVRAGGTNIAAGTINSNTWYDFKIEKQENVVWFYSRVNGTGTYNLLTAIPYSGTQTVFRFGSLMYGSAGNYGGFNTRNWVINDNPPTTNLTAGTYTYKVYDAPGCYASTTIVVPSTSNFTVSALPVKTSKWNVCDGTVSISSNSGGNLSYLSKLYSNGFSGTTLNTAEFVTRNGSFSQNNALVQGNLLNNSAWDNSIATSRVFTDNSKLVTEMEMQFRSGTEVYFGLSDAGSVLSSNNAMAYAFRYASGSLYAYVSGSGSSNVFIGNVSANQWNSYKIEKAGNTVKFYIRPVQDNQYQLLYTATVSPNVVNYRLGILNFFATSSADRSYLSRNWKVYNAALTSGLCMGDYTYSVLEAGGCSADVTFKVGTNLALVQTMTAPANVTVNTNANNAFATGVALGNPSFEETPTGITITNNAPAQFPVGNTIITWSAVDASGLVVTGAQTITVVDNQPPAITAPANVNITVYGGQTTATGVALGNATATDNVPGVTVSNNAPSVFPEGTTIVKWTATDAAGNTAFANQAVTVVAVSIPRITAPANISVPTDLNKSYASNVVLGTPTLSNDNVPGITITNNAPSVFPVGTTAVVWTVSDNFGNSNASTQTVTVVDNQPPVLVAPANITVPLLGPSPNAILGSASATDNVPGVTITNNAPSTYPVGVTIVTWTATDAAGNTTTTPQTVTVIDNIRPSITAPSGILVSTDIDKAYATGVALGTPTASDNVPGVTVSNNAPAQFPLGITIVTWTARDVAGNTRTATQTVTVRDTQAPAITAPANVNITIGLNQGSATGVALGTATASDNVPGVTVSNNAPLSFPLGITTITWTATDAAGNTATATQTVTVSVISLPPVANCKPVTVTLINGVATISVSDVNNGSTAAAGIASISLSKKNFNCSNIGSNPVTLTVTDNNGLSSTCTTTVTVVGTVSVVSVTSVPTSNTYTGGISTNLYLGYGAQSTKLVVNAPASGAPYTYSWNGSGLSNTTAAAPVFTPTAAGYYTLTVTATNRFGCASTASIAICVKDIRASADGKKVYVCHIPPGNPANAHVIEVSINAVDAHLDHGDQLGSCNQACGTAAKGIAAPLVIGQSFEVKVSPNPASSYFLLQVKSGDKENKVTVRIADAFGRTVQNEVMTAGNTIQFGERYVNGTYFAEVVQGKERKVVKLMKL